MFSLRKKTEIPTPAEALPGRPAAIPTAETHFVNGRPLAGPYPKGTRTALFGLGCFWGAERKFWQSGEGIWVTAVGYAGGATPNPTYEEVCSGLTGHTEVVLVIFDPVRIAYEDLLKIFWENHDPTQGMRQGGDIGTQYRSAIYWTTPEQRRAAEATRDAFQGELDRHGHGPISTELRPFEEAGPFYLAEDYHQQYLDKNPGGYCNHGPNGLTCQIGLLRQDGVPAQTSVEPPA